DHHEHDGKDEDGGDEERELGLEGVPHLAPLHRAAALVASKASRAHAARSGTWSAVMRSESLPLRECPTPPHFIAAPPLSPPRPPAPPLRDHAPTPRDWAPRRSNIRCSPCGRWPRRRRGRARFPARGEGG